MGMLNQRVGIQQLPGGNGRSLMQNVQDGNASAVVQQLGSVVKAIVPNPDRGVSALAAAAINNPLIVAGAAAQDAGAVVTGGKRRQVGTGISSQLGINV